MRRTERQLVVDYVALVDELLPLLATDPAEAARVANLVDVVRGYEGVKMANIADLPRGPRRDPPSLIPAWVSVDDTCCRPT